MIGLGFACDCLRKCGPTTKRNKAKTEQFWITFDTRLKIILTESVPAQKFNVFYVIDDEGL